MLLFSLAAEIEIDEMLGPIWTYRKDGAFVAAPLKDDQIPQFHRRGIPIILKSASARPSLPPAYAATHSGDA